MAQVTPAAHCCSTGRPFGSDDVSHGQHSASRWLRISPSPEQLDDIKPSASTKPATPAGARWCTTGCNQSRGRPPTQNGGLSHARLREESLPAGTLAKNIPNKSTCCATDPSNRLSGNGVSAIPALATPVSPRPSRRKHPPQRTIACGRSRPAALACAIDRSLMVRAERRRQPPRRPCQDVSEGRRPECAAHRGCGKHCSWSDV